MKVLGSSPDSTSATSAPGLMTIQPTVNRGEMISTHSSFLLIGFEEPGSE
jgi:hypothetical protein